MAIATYYSNPIDQARACLISAQHNLEDGFKKAALTYAYEALGYARMTNNRVFRAYCAQVVEKVTSCVER